MELEADLVVLAVGLKADDRLYEACVKERVARRYITSAIPSVWDASSRRPRLAMPWDSRFDKDGNLTC